MAPKEKYFVALSQVIRVVVLVIFVTILPGCSRSKPEAQTKVPTDAILLTGAGSTFASVIFNRWFAAYTRAIPKVSSSTQLSAAVKGFAALSETTSLRKKGLISALATMLCPTQRSNGPTTMR